MLLHLVLYSPHDEYQQMYELTRAYYGQFTNVKTIYYHYSPDQTEEYVLIDDILRIKGTEVFGPAITVKTIKAFEYFEADLFSYDYIIRSNISTIVNFHVLQRNLRQYELQHTSIDYAGSINVIKWRDPDAGIVTDEWIGLETVSGICIILSSMLVKNLLDHKQFIRFDIMDDVAIGIYAKEVSIPITSFTDMVQWMPNCHGNYDEVKQIIGDTLHQTMLYRNRNNESREIDVHQMSHIITLLQEVDESVWNSTI